jgi:hypothetical protein
MAMGEWLYVNTSVDNYLREIDVRAEEFAQIPGELIDADSVVRSRVPPALRFCCSLSERCFQCCRSCFFPEPRRSPAESC